MKIEIVFPDGLNLKQEKIPGGIRLIISIPPKTTNQIKMLAAKPIAKKSANPAAVTRFKFSDSITATTAHKVGSTSSKPRKKKGTSSTGPKIKA